MARNKTSDRINAEMAAVTVIYAGDKPAADAEIQPSAPAKPKRDNSKFKGGMRGAVYTCDCCHRQTRDTGIGEHVGICAFCYEAAGIDNGYSDGAIDGPTAVSQYEDLVKQYGKRAHVDCLSFSFAAENPQVPTEAEQVKALIKDISEQVELDRKPHPGFTGCTGLTKAGKACTMPPIKGTDKCFNHRKG